MARRISRFITQVNGYPQTRVPKSDRKPPLIITLESPYTSHLPRTTAGFISRGAGNRFRNTSARDCGSFKRMIRRSTLGGDCRSNSSGVEISAYEKRVPCQKHGIGFVANSGGLLIGASRGYIAIGCVLPVCFSLLVEEILNSLEIRL